MKFKQKSMVLTDDIIIDKYDDEDAFVNDGVGESKYNSQIKNSKIFELNIDDVTTREKNDFNMKSINSLKESIMQVGLLTPIIVRAVANNKFIAIAGNRRLTAVKSLHEEFKDDERWNTIKAQVVQIEGEVEPNPNYITITKDTEEQIYRDTNFENRQIDLETVIKHIDYLHDKIINSIDFKKKCMQEDEINNELVAKNRTVINEPRIISNILVNELGFNLSEVSVYRILKIREKDPSKLVDIAKKTSTIKTIYNELYPVKEKKKIESQSWSPLKKELKRSIKYLNEIFESNTKIKKKELDNITEVEELIKKFTELTNKI